MHPDADLTGRVAVITGAASGIGAGTAEALAAAGLHLVLADIEDAGQVAATLAQRYGVRTLAVSCDVTEREQVEQLAREAFAAFDAVHLLFNNAGVMPVGPLLQTGLDDWRWLIEVNLYGVLNGLSAFVPRMLAQGARSRVVTTASMASFQTSQTVAAYTSSKHAVLAVMESLRLELDGTSVAVSVVLPGAVDTEIAQSERNRQARFGPPNGRRIPESEDGRQAAAQLISPREAGRRIVAGLVADEFWIFTHPTWARRVGTRFDEAAEAARRQIERLAVT